ncbi:MAG TPA: aldose epimerase family protein [Terriglobales bacterium]|nr:aldose epimerase family protein [Terriglobales bacterium]
MMKTMLAVLAISLATVAVAEAQQKTDIKPGLKMESFGKTPDGQEVQLFTLTNKNGVEARITNFGGIIVSLKTPDRKGQLADIVLGYDNLDGYIGDKAFLGALIGRYGNRIAKGEFKLDGKTYHLPLNDGPNTLHGGPDAFNKKVWTAKDVSTHSTPMLQLTYVSKDGENGFPGTLTAVVSYSLTNSNELRIDYSATTDKDTVLNLTNHSYFNLKGAGEGDILQHELRLNANKFTPVDATLIPTGELKNVQGTPFDFRKSTAIGARINADDQQLKYAGGYDHNWVLNSLGSGQLVTAAHVYEPTTGRVLEVMTDQPGLQFYTGNFLDGTIHGKGGKVYQKRGAFCLETQHFPDSPNHPSFPTTELKPGEKFHSTTIFKFGAQ